MGVMASVGMKGLQMGARHAVSGTLPGQLVMKTPLTRRLTNAGDAIATGVQAQGAARTGADVPNPNKTAADQAINTPVVTQQIDSGSLKEANVLAAALPIALTPVVAAGVGAVQNAYHGHRAEKAWQQVTSENKGFGTKQDRENFMVLKDFAPSMAANPTVLRSHLMRGRQMDVVPHEMVSDLASTQDKIRGGSMMDVGLRSAVMSVPKMKTAEQASDLCKVAIDPARVGAVIGGLGGAGLTGTLTGGAIGSAAGHHIGSKLRRPEEVLAARPHEKGVMTGVGGAAFRTMTDGVIGGAAGMGLGGLVGGPGGALIGAGLGNMVGSMHGLRAGWRAGNQIGNQLHKQEREEAERALKGQQKKKAEDAGLDHALRDALAAFDV